MKKILLFLIVSFPFLSFSQVERDGGTRRNEKTDKKHQR